MKELTGCWLLMQVIIILALTGEKRKQLILNVQHMYDLTSKLIVQDV